MDGRDFNTPYHRGMGCRYVQWNSRTDYQRRGNSGWRPGAQIAPPRRAQHSHNLNHRGRRAAGGNRRIPHSYLRRAEGRVAAPTQPTNRQTLALAKNYVRASVCRFVLYRDLKILRIFAA